MLLRIKTLFSKKNIKKLLRSTLCLLLCVLTVVFFGGLIVPIQAEAVTGVDDVIVFVIGIMVACGVTFSSSAVAQSTAQRFYNSADTETKDIIDKAYEQYEAKKEYYTTTTYGLIICLANEWQHIFDAIAAFIYTPSVIAAIDYVDFSVANMSSYDSFVSLLETNGTLEFEFQCTTTAYTSFTVGNTLIELIGKEKCTNVPPEVMTEWNRNNTAYWKDCNVLMKISILGTQYTFYQALYESKSFYNNYIQYFNHTYNFKLNDNGAIIYTYDNGGAKGSLISGNNYISQAYFGPYSYMYYGSELVNATPTYDGKTYTLTAPSIGSIVCDDGTIFGTDYSIPCDADRITDDILTKTFTCDPSISIGNEYIGTDTTWTDSIADAGSGSIAFPLDVDDLIDSSASDVRDKTLTDTGDIATDKPATGENTETDKDSKPNKPSIPGLSLPEILFKEKFPFCLPWDIYNLFVGLQAEEEAPRFVVPFKFERLGIDEEIVIDFGDYEEQIKIIRFFIGAMFVFALIMVSRKIIGAQ